MIRFNRLKSRLLIRYIVSYLLIFLVPFIIMSSIIYYNSVSSLRQEIEQSNLNKLKQVEHITNERMKELKKLAARISYDTRLTPYMISHGYYGGVAINELKKYKANSSIIDELFVYYYQDDIIYSTKGSYSIDTFLNKYQFEEWNREEFKKDLHTKKPFIRPAEKVLINSEHHENMIAYLFSIEPNSSNPYGTVMYLIEESEIKGLIQNILGEFEGNSYILNGNNKVIASTVGDKSINPSDVDFLTNNKQGVSNVEINGKDYSLVTLTSELSDWTFITLMDSDQFFEQLSNSKILFSGILLILLLIGLLLAVLLGRNQYKPIRNLFEITDRDGKQGEGKAGVNELETIHNAITNVFESHQILNETMYKQKPFARDQLLIRLLKGDLKDNDEIGSLLNSLNIKMNSDHYFVAIICYEQETLSEDNMKERENILDLLADILLNDASLYGVDLLYNNAMALVVSMDQGEVEAHERRKVLVNHIQQYIQANSFISPTIGVGDIYDEKSLINRSYIEALAATEYKFANPKGSIIYFEDISSQPGQELGYPKDEQVKLIQSLKQGDQVVAAETLANMFATIENKNLSIQVLKCVCFDIINSIIKTSSELGLNPDIHDFNNIVDFRSIEQLHKRLLKVVSMICEDVESRKESHNDELRNRILDYIKLNYNLYDLSLEKIAIEFQQSMSYLSRFIKEQTGTTFTQYIQELRMEKVKKQLRMTNLPIKTIVTQVGYKDVANFTRKFKKIVGVTPGQYRKLNN